MNETVKSYDSSLLTYIFLPSHKQFSYEDVTINMACSTVSILPKVNQKKKRWDCFCLNIPQDPSMVLCERDAR